MATKQKQTVFPPLPVVVFVVFTSRNTQLPIMSHDAIKVFMLQFCDIHLFPYVCKATKNFFREKLVGFFLCVFIFNLCVCIKQRYFCNLSWLMDTQLLSK